MIVTDLDEEITALRAAVLARDETAAGEHLATIESALERMNPLLRGMTYAHVKSVLGRPREAAAVLEDLRQLMPEDGMLCYQLGCYRRAAGELDEALIAFTQATALDPARVDAWLERGSLLDARGEPQQAIEAYRHAILRAPAQVDAWRNLGNSLAALACFDEALEAYRTASRLAPGDATLAFLMASAHQAKGDLEAAHAQLPPGWDDRALEVRAQAHGVDLRARFHASAPRVPALRAAAERLLHVVAQELAAGPVRAFPWARESVSPREPAWIVQQAEWLLLCDGDAVRPGPHRFFDATRAVQDAASEAKPG